MHVSPISNTQRIQGSPSTCTETAKRAPGGLEAAGLAVRAGLRCAVFIVSMIPSRRRPVDWITRAPRVEHVSVVTRDGPIDVDLYRPRGGGPHPGVVVGFGLNPAATIDPRVPQMGGALARAGFAALLYWPPSARDLTIELRDVEELVAAFQVLLRQPGIEASRCGFVGICVGGATALIAATDPAIRDRVAFVCAYAPYSSMRTLAVDIASRSRTLGMVREPWDVDPLTWTVYVRTVTDWLTPDEAQRLREAFDRCTTWNNDKTVILHAPAGFVDPAGLSEDARAALRVLLAGEDDIERALDELPPAAQARLTALSPIRFVDDLVADVILLHDRDDLVIPVGESRRLWAAIAGRGGSTYTEPGFRHLRLPKHTSVGRIVRELVKGYMGWYPLFRRVAQ